MRLIDADNIPYSLTKDGDVVAYPDAIAEMPTIEAERKKGKWVDDGCDERCSECGEKQEFPHWQFCPKCGTDMRG